MSVLDLPRTTQPAQQVGLSRFGRGLGLKFLVNPAVPVNAATGLLLDKAGSFAIQPIPRLGGMCFSVSATQQRYTAPGAPTGTGFDLSYFAFIRLDSFTTNSRVIGISNSTGFGVVLEVEGNPGIPGRVFLVKGYAANLDSGISLQLGVPYFISASYTHESGVANFVIVNLNTGVVSTSSATNSTAFIAGDGTFQYGGVEWLNLASMTAGQLGLAGFSDRAIPPGQLLQIARNPWQLFEPARRFVPVAFDAGAPAPIELAGTATGTASAAGSLTTSIRLAGTAQAAATASGALTTGIPLAGSAAASATASAALATSIRLAGSASATATATASLQTSAAELSGTASATATASGSLLTGIRLAGQATGQAQATGALSTAIILSGTAQAQATSTAALTADGAGLAGTASATATASGSLTTGIRFAGTAAASATATASLSTGGSELSGTAMAQAIASADLSTQIRLSGTATATAAATASLTTSSGALAGTAQASATATASLFTQIRLAGTAQGRATAAGNLSTGSSAAFVFGNPDVYHIPYRQRVTWVAPRVRSYGL